jgi:hypothetical protein
MLSIQPFHDVPPATPPTMPSSAYLGTAGFACDPQLPATNMYHLDGIGESTLPEQPRGPGSGVRRSERKRFVVDVGVVDFAKATDSIRLPTVTIRTWIVPY